MMAKGRNQRLRFKRRRTAETDYHRRMRMLKGGGPRAVVRISNTQVTCQLVSYENEGDRKVLVEKIIEMRKAAREWGLWENFLIRAIHFMRRVRICSWSAFQNFS